MLTFNRLYLLCAHKLLVISGIASCILLFIIYLLFFHNRNSVLLFLLIYAEVICTTIISTILVYRIYETNKHSNKRFNKQIFSLFSFASLIPILFMFASSLTFFDAGINNFFKAPVKNAVQHSLKISDVYINSLKDNLSEYSSMLAFSLSNKNSMEIKQILNNEQLSRKVDFILFETDINCGVNIIYKTQFSSELQFFLTIKNFATLLMSNEQTYEIEGYVISIKRINNSMHLATISQIDEEIITHRENIKIANEQYMKLSLERLRIKSSFISLFTCVSLVIILTSVFLGLIYSRKILLPINKIMNAINEVSNGNYKMLISLTKQNNEWDDLVCTFNDMVKAINDSGTKIATLSKQTAWKEMARKMAHEIKNPLTPILLSAERLRRKFSKEAMIPPEIFNTCIDTIIRQANNINSLVKEFSDFARLPEPKPELNDLKKLLDENISMYSNSYPEITFKSCFKHEKLIFKFDYSQINQVVTNVIINAIHAITENVNEESRKVILITCELSDDDVFITIEDDGIGFTDLVLNKAFEPYYTTRKNGTGLGLAISYKIMSDHNGQIILSNSQVLRGAKVTLILPYEK